jgi:hypothetical protein
VSSPASPSLGAVVEHKTRETSGTLYTVPAAVLAVLGGTRPCATFSTAAAVLNTRSA